MLFLPSKQIACKENENNHDKRYFIFTTISFSHTLVLNNECTLDPLQRAGIDLEGTKTSGT
jgi:hypothetical protein